MPWPHLAACVLFDKESGQNASTDIPLLQRNQQQFNLQKITSQNCMAADLQSWGGTHAQDLVLAPWRKRVQHVCQDWWRQQHQPSGTDLCQDAA